MSSPPKVFISTTSGDLHSVRELVKNALLTISCHSVEQTNFPPDYQFVRDMRRGCIKVRTAARLGRLTVYIGYSPADWQVFQALLSDETVQ